MHGGIPSPFQGFAFEFHEAFVSPFPPLVEFTLRGEEGGEASEQTLPFKSEAEEMGALAFSISVTVRFSSRSAVCVLLTFLLALCM